MLGFWTKAWTDVIAPRFSPYEINPLNINPLRDAIDALIDFDRVLACTDVGINISATNVWTGKIAIFQTQELTADHLMASACLPRVFQAVEIDGVPYWDGGYMGNPALFPLFDETMTDDILLVQINPLERRQTPRTVRENCRSFDRLVPVLAGAGHHVVTMDLRGRGRSEITPPGSYGWDSHVRDLLEIAELYGADSFDVLGHSMGGFIGMSLAAQYPRRCSRLVLIDALGEPEPSALVPITKSISRLGRTYESVPAVLSYMQAAGTIAPWDEFWDSYFAWELEPVDDTVRIRTDLAAVGEDAAYGSTYDVYGLWPRLRCPVLLVRASRPMAPGGGLVVSRADAERFAAEARDATVVDVDADHYSILISPPAISAVERFVGAGAA